MFTERQNFAHEARGLNNFLRYKRRIVGLTHAHVRACRCKKHQMYVQLVTLGSNSETHPQKMGVCEAIDFPDGWLGMQMRH